MLPVLIAAAAGLVHAASMAMPWGGQPQGWLQVVALGVLARQLLFSRSPSHGALLGWAFATPWLIGTFWWLFIAMNTYGGLHAILAAAAVLLLAAVLAIYYAAICGAFVALAPAGVAWSAIVFASLWTLAEMARGTWFTGFGWGAAAYAHLDGLAVTAKYVGAYGVGWLAALLATLIAKWVSRPADLLSRPAQAWALAMVLLVLASQHSYTSSASSIGVALLQGNIAQDEKFEPGTCVADALQWYGEQLRENRVSLVVAPETAIPLLPQQLPEGYWAALQQNFSLGDRAALIGMPLGSYALGYTNSVLGLKPRPPESTSPAGEATPENSALYRYDKHHLVPFGEFIPPFFRWFTDLMRIPLGDFNQGSVGQPSFEWQGQRLAPNVCYEDLFGEELGARFIDPANAPTIFVNVSNIAWFGNTVAIDQHLQISRMRSLEFERPMLRATNTGDTVIIDHRARVTHALPRHTRGVLVGEVEGRHGITPYAWWVSRLGLWPMWLLCAGVVALAEVRRRRNRNRTQGSRP